MFDAIVNFKKEGWCIGHIEGCILARLVLNDIVDVSTGNWCKSRTE